MDVPIDLIFRYILYARTYIFGTRIKNMGCHLEKKSINKFGQVYLRWYNI